MILKDGPDIYNAESSQGDDPVGSSEKGFLGLLENLL